MNIIQIVILKLKIFIKINYSYHKDRKFQRIKSVLASNTIVGEDVVVGEGVEIDTCLENISDGVFIGKNTYIGACNFIGKYTSISDNVKIGLVSHPLNFISTSPVFYAKRRGWTTENKYNEKFKGYTEIGNDVLISANVCILAGVKIGTGAVIAAGAVVINDVPPYAIVGGVPGKILKYRFNPEVIEILMDSKWWDYPINILKNSVSLSENPIEFIKSLKLKC